MALINEMRGGGGVSERYLAGVLGALLLEVLELHDLSHNESLLEVRVYTSGRLWGFRAFLSFKSSMRCKGCVNVCNGYVLLV